MSLPLLQTAEVFAEQVTTNQLVQNTVYASGTVGAIFVLVGLLLIDAGGLRRRNIANATAEKLIGFFIGFSVYFLIGFAFWAAQYNRPFYANAWEAIVETTKLFWVGGSLSNELAQNVDPAVWPALNSFQIFIFFLACFAGLINVLLHFAVSERMRPLAYYITCVVATIVSSLLSYATWGSVGWLTNEGFHDFFGVGFVYMFTGGMALVFVIALGRRPGMYEAHPKVSEYRIPNNGLVIAGVATVFAGLPMVILSCLFFFDPEALAVAATMSDTSTGIAFNNYGMAWAGGTLGGALIAYVTKKYSYIALGAFGGYVACAVAFDIYKPWQTFLVAFGAPFIALVIYEFMKKRGVDEHKLIPLFIGCGTYGMIMAGLIGWGIKGGGYPGYDAPWAFQGAEITLWMQLIGVVVVLGAGILTALVLTLIFKAAGILRISDDQQAEGLDKVYWGIEPDVEPAAESR
jgi:Amt family ammonium transporter